jgi:hypothetical protein
VVVNSYVRDILLRLQEYISKHNIKWSSFIEKYSHQVIDFNIFSQILKEVDPLITTHEATILFEHLDKDKKSQVNWRLIENYIAKVDYRSTEDIFSRKADEIVAILREKKIEPAVLFEQIDLNHSGLLDFSEFSRFIVTIAPCYTKP